MESSQILRKWEQSLSGLPQLMLEMSVRFLDYVPIIGSSFGDLPHFLVLSTIYWNPCVQFEWSTECELAFSELKSPLTYDKVMAYPCNTGTFIPDTDASAFGIGATLSQVQVNPANGTTEERPIAYASRTLTKTQRRYCVTRRELLAVVTFVHHFRHYFILGQESGGGGGGTRLSNG